MMKRRNKAVRLYLKELRRALDCPGNLKRAFTDNMRDMLGDVSETATLAELYEEFGTPEDIAAGFDATENLYALKAQAKRLGRIMTGLSAVTGGICAILIALLLIPNPFIQHQSYTFSTKSDDTWILSVEQSSPNVYIITIGGNMNGKSASDELIITTEADGTRTEGTS